MDGLVKTVSSTVLNNLSGWDWLIAGIIVLLVEYVVKAIFKDEKFKIIWKIAPIILGVVIYLVYTLVAGGVWYKGLLLGLEVGLIAIGYYDIILKTMKTTGKKGLEDTNEAIKKAINNKT